MHSVEDLRLNGRDSGRWITSDARTRLMPRVAGYKRPPVARDWRQWAKRAPCSGSFSFVIAVVLMLCTHGRDPDRKSEERGQRPEAQPIGDASARQPMPYEVDDLAGLRGRHQGAGPVTIDSGANGSRPHGAQPKTVVLVVGLDDEGVPA